MFVGTGKRLSQGDVGIAARSVGIPTAALLAFMEVEAAGRGFDNQKRPKHLFEPHVFYRNLSGTALNLAIKAGLAYASWKRNYPKESYTRLKAAIKIRRNAAFMSGSFGLGQIMGFNHKYAGFKSAEDMFHDAKKGEYEQLLQVVRLMKAWGLADMLKGVDLTKPDSWRPVAKRYNGRSYAKNNYHVKLARSFVKHSGKANFPEKIVSSILKKGSKSEAVRNLQTDLQFLGYEFVLGVDGRFGQETKDNVEDFQEDHDLKKDGIAGPKTLAAIAKAVKEAKEDKTPEVVFDKSKSVLSIILDLLEGMFK